MEKLTEKYGLLTAICMVVGTVIGSGVFFKAQNVLTATGGRMLLGIVAWIITGLIMIICSAQFAVMGTKYEKVSGVIDYAEATCGKGYAYYLAWFMVNVYYPGMSRHAIIPLRSTSVACSRGMERPTTLPDLPRRSPSRVTKSILPVASRNGSWPSSPPSSIPRR